MPSPHGFKLYHFFYMDKEGNARRKRKDPQSRDFTCLCGKSYLSYAAAYTHAKHKHADDQSFIQGIIKPQRQKLKRGRPKEKKSNNNTTQTIKLTLIQSTILRICEKIQETFSHAVLEGNEERSPQDYHEQFTALCSEFGSIKIENIQEPQQEFLQSLIKDFNAEVSARVKFVCTVLSTQKKQDKRLLSELNHCNLWYDCRGINEIIHEALVQWRTFSSLPPQHDSNYD